MCLFAYPLCLADEAQLTPLLRLGAGACAGIIAMSATYPMDMVRGRLTVQVFFGFWSIGISHCAEKSFSSYHFYGLTLSI